MQMQNPQEQQPNVSEDAWISETAVIVGNVTISDDVFAAPNAVIRADEAGSSVVIGSGCNVQDNVVIHPLSNSNVSINDKISLDHGYIVHGPCLVGEGCFIGFGSVVFGCKIGTNSLILHNSTVHGVEIPNGKLVVPSGKNITEKADAKNFEDIKQDHAEFKSSVIIAI